ncbi:MAG TPA: hypothetical protein VHG33_09440 [Woeseiaceae bacterium]|nr:hypothetical protein [Woeseiaceae bacterium]
MPRIIKESCSSARDRGAGRRQSLAIGNLGAIALLVGDTDEAELCLQQSVEIGEQPGWQSSIAYDLVNLGGLAREQEADVADVTGRAECPQAASR